jgi:protein arginine kinase activator
MECDFCHQKATVFLTQLVEGQMKKMCLCENCAREKGVTDPTGFALADLLLAGGMPAHAQTGGESSGRACPECGFTLADLKRVRRFGCGTCYQTFRAEVETMLRGMHLGRRHVGKVPRGQMERHQRNQRLEQLRVRLDHAIAAENYEEAAGLRDEIRGIEAGSAVTD